MTAPGEAADRQGQGAAFPRGEWLALGALLMPWYVLSAFLPLPQMALAFALLLALTGLLLAIGAWARVRAEELRLDADTWALAVTLSLGYGALMLFGSPSRSGFDVVCDECGRLHDARAAFCYGCGSLG